MSHIQPFILLVTLTSGVLSDCNSTDIIPTTSGPVRGCQHQLELEGKSYSWKEYLGIPYATPPLGDLRFKRPTPPQPWTEVLEATKHGLICYQFGYILISPGEKGEDCLTINIYTPKVGNDLGDSSEGLAVMVFVHGGGYQIGSSQEYHSPYLSIMGNVILVTLNYRLGPLGFLSTGDSVVPGNNGIWDVIQALKWLNVNLKAFGGDPKKVTIFGESAGSILVSHLLTSPRVDKRLFQRAIMQSGTLFSFLSSRDEVVARSRSLAKEMNCEKTDSAALVKCLEHYSAEALVNNTLKVSADGMFAPLVDGDLLTADSCSLLQNVMGRTGTTTANLGSFDIMLGYNSQEGLLWAELLNPLSLALEGRNISEGISETVYKRGLDQALRALNPGGNASSRLINAVRYYYEQGFSDMLENRTADEKRLKFALELIGDYVFTWPAVLQAVQHQRESSQRSTYFYIYDHKRTEFPALFYEGPDWLRTGADHADELVHVFGKTLQEDIQGLGRTLTRSMIDYWTNFAKFGNPTPDTREWMPFTENREFVTITAQGLQAGKSPASSVVTLWNAMVSSACQAGANSDQHNSQESRPPSQLSGTEPAYTGLLQLLSMVAVTVIATHLAMKFFLSNT